MPSDWEEALISAGYLRLYVIIKYWKPKKCYFGRKDRYSMSRLSTIAINADRRKFLGPRGSR